MQHLDSARLHLEAFQGIESASKKWYKHIEILGSGGNAITTLVVGTSDEHRGTFYALKIFKKLAQPKRRKRFQDETDFLRTCSHPAIMRVFDTGTYKYSWEGTDYEYPFIVAEYLPKTLADVIREGNATLPEKISYVMQLLSALVFVHSRSPQVVHRDIKPANIFVKGNSCVLGDFGLLKVLSADSSPDPKFFLESLDGRIPWLYRSQDLVEYARGERPLTVKSDIFQAGLVACELFTGKLPIATPKRMLEDVEHTGIPKIHGGFGPSIAHVIKAMLSPNFNARPSAQIALNSWERIFWDSVRKMHEIEGHAFRK